ncbi:hypothetical protein [Vibrio phage RYC]|nr:hypothetical protein [Vibrio phage RYC]
MNEEQKHVSDYMEEVISQEEDRSRTLYQSWDQVKGYVFDALDKEEELERRVVTSENSVCISGEIVNGVHRQYSSEYLDWNLKAMWAKIATCLSEEERKQWFIDNKPPENKFK